MKTSAWLIACLAVTVAAARCGSLSDEVKPCGEIPADGCPIGRGGTCEDTLCAALYDCVDGAWTEVKACAGFDGGTAGASSGATGAGGGMSDGGPDGCTPVTIDHSGETTGCAPDLQVPDCPAVAAEECASTACLTDCTDFFLCTSRGWTAVAFCDDRGHVVVTQ